MNFGALYGVRNSVLRVAVACCPCCLFSCLLLFFAGRSPVGFRAKPELLPCCFFSLATLLYDLIFFVDDLAEGLRDAMPVDQIDAER
jgi:hypothetical protein